MNRFIISKVFLLFAFSPTLNAGNLGLGVSIKPGETAVYLPIKVSEFYKVEPFIEYSKNSSELISPHSPDSQNDDADSQNDDYSTRAIGVGLFRSKEMGQSANLYYGLRASFTKVKSRRQNKSSYTYGDTTEITINKTRGSERGFILSPTVGVAYSFAQQFVLALEAQLNFGKYKGKESYYDKDLSKYIEASTERKEQSGTDTKVILRYFF